MTPAPPANTVKEVFREVPVKVHYRKASKDSWKYVGRALVSHEVYGQFSRVVLRSASSNKMLTSFSELTDVQVDKRDNFIVVACVDGLNVVSWSLNALNNAEALRLMTSIELACYRSQQAVSDPILFSRSRRRIERVVRDDRRRRHQRRKVEDELANAFAKQEI